MNKKRILSLLAVAALATTIFTTTALASNKNHTTKQAAAYTANESTSANTDTYGVQEGSNYDSTMGHNAWCQSNDTHQNHNAHRNSNHH